MISFPNAKINLGLDIVSKRPDGYHNLETIFYPIQIKDALEITESAENTAYTFHCNGLEVDGPPENNLVIKALNLLKQSHKIPNVDIHMIKHIPFGAGLGGGSADASFTLKMLNTMFNLGISVKQLEAYAAQLGADCAFFIQNKPVFASGIGNIFKQIDLSLKGYYLILVKPDVHISTAQAFSQITPSTPSHSLLEIIKKPVDEWKYVMKNDFEKSVFPLFPIIEQVKNDLYQHGACYASMSGSGSSVFGIFKTEIDLQTAFPGMHYWGGYLD